MRIAENVDVRIGVFDIETYLELFDIGIYDPDTKKWVEFEISAYKNDLYSFVKYYTSNHHDYWVSFNGIGFDHQVLEYIIHNYNDWTDLTNLEICKKISDFASRVIDDQNYNISPPYRESGFSVKPIDVFRIHHFDNEAKRTSLKWCEYMMNMNIEEMPIHHLKQGLTEEEIQSVKSYRKNDVIATLALLYLTLGEIDKIVEVIKEFFDITVTLDELSDYSGKNKIQDRFDVYAQTGMYCLNWSDVKIGEEWNKLDYKSEENIKDDSQLFTKKITKIYGRKFKEFFPPTMKFETDLFKNFVKELGDEYVKSVKQEFNLTVGNTVYTIAKGGIHSTEKHRILLPGNGIICRDADVGSQYPCAISKYKIFPPHLKPTIIVQFEGKIEKRFVFKDKAKELKSQGKEKEARPFSSVQEMLKLCLNGGYYGKLNQSGSFLEHPEGYLKVCMGNQIEILMLIEDMEMAGFNVVSGNTDGIVVMFPADKEDLYNKICKDWEDQVGNKKLGKLEYTDFSCMWQESINHYIGKKVNGGVKKKGRFMTEYEINKKKDFRIIPLALEAYFIRGEDPIKFIQNHKNIFDFCTGKKGYQDLHYEEIDDEGKMLKRHDKVLRYYISKKGNVIKKRGWHKNEKGKNIYMDAFCEAQDTEFPWIDLPKQKEFNNPVIYEDFSKYEVDYSFYILKTLKRIDKIEKSKKAKTYADTFKSTQLSMF